jgi:hypothetical protein
MRITSWAVMIATAMAAPTAADFAAAQGSLAASQPSRSLQTEPVRPDLQGIWQVMNTAAWDIQDHPAQLFPGLPARFGTPAGQGVVAGNEVPYLPAALARKKQNFENRLTADPEASCYLPGVPRITYMPFPFQIFQFSDRVVILYEYLHTTRVIFTDGSPHPKELSDFWDFWMGDSRGHWEGNTLVVDVIHFNDQTWFDRAGNFHSDALHVIERYTRTGADHILYEATIEDPKVFMRPWRMSMVLYRRQEKNMQLLEYECYAYAREAADQLKTPK